MSRFTTHPRVLPFLFACLLAACGGGGGDPGAGAGGNAGGSGTAQPEPLPLNSVVMTNLRSNVSVVPLDSVVRMTVFTYPLPYDDLFTVPDDLRYRWTLPDGITSDAPYLEQTFTSTGRYILRLDVSDSLNRAEPVATLEARVRPVRLEPRVITVGGPGMRDGSAAAMFDGPVALQPAPDGGMLVLDRDNSAIRKIDAEGSLSTVAGTPTRSGQQFGRFGVGQLDRPTSFAVDAQGRMFVADGAMLKRVSASGAIERIPGNDFNPSSGLPWPVALAATPSGDFYIATRSTLHLYKDGKRSLLAGLDTERRTVDGPAQAARFEDIRALAAGTDGDVWIQDGCHLLRRLTRDGQVRTVATLEVPSFARCGTGVALAPGGGVYVATSSDVKLVQADGSMRPVVLSGGWDAVAVDRQGRLYTARTDHHAVTRHGPGPVATFGLSSEKGYSYPSSGQSFAGFDPVRQFAVHPSGDLYFVDKARLCRVDQWGDVSCVAGRSGNANPVDGPRGLALLSSWEDSEVIIDRAGRVYFTDQRALRRFSVETGEVSTIAGVLQGGPGDDLDGSGTAAGFLDPFSLAMDSKGNVLAIANKNRIIRISETGAVTTVARFKRGDRLLRRLLVGPDDQLLVQASWGAYRVDNSGELVEMDGFADAGYNKPSFVGPSVLGPDGAIWVLDPPVNAEYQRHLRPVLMRMSLSGTTRTALEFGPFRRQLAPSLPPFEFNPKFQTMAIDPQGRLVLSDGKTFGFWRLSVPVSENF
jgi:hypothetical protein